MEFMNHSLLRCESWRWGGCVRAVIGDRRLLADCRLSRNLSPLVATLELDAALHDLEIGCVVAVHL